MQTKKILTYYIVRKRERRIQRGRQRFCWVDKFNGALNWLIWHQMSEKRERESEWKMLLSEIWTDFAMHMQQQKNWEECTLTKDAFYLQEEKKLKTKGNAWQLWYGGKLPVSRRMHCANARFCRRRPLYLACASKYVQMCKYKTVCVWECVWYICVRRILAFVTP